MLLLQVKEFVKEQKNSIMNTEELQIKVEQFGVWFEKRGWSPVSGRIFGYLLLSDPPHRTHEEIQEFLQISKSAVNTNLKQLLTQEVVDYLTFSGNRKRYFKVDTERWLQVAKKSAEQVTDFAEILEKVIDSRNKKENDSFNKGLNKVANFYQHLSTGINNTINHWEAKAS